ncbi:MAG: DUF5684 domain-containing protein [Actinomycetia bacterium]|nr:DUF5684 domain-containing protein [Actinomycetes bacterium]
MVDQQAIAILLTAGIFGVVVALAVYCVAAFFLSRIFQKAGLPTWWAWVPFFAQWKFLELGGQPGWLILAILLAWIPVIGWICSVAAYVFMAIAAYNIGQKFHKEDVWVVLYIFLPIVWLGIIGLGSSTFDPSKGKPSRNYPGTV